MEEIEAQESEEYTTSELTGTEEEVEVSSPSPVLPRPSRRRSSVSAKCLVCK